MKIASIVLTIILTMVLLPAYAVDRDEVINKLRTDNKLPAKDTYGKITKNQYRKILREKKKKKGKKGDLGIDTISCPKCPFCPSTTPSSSQCIEPTSLRSLLASRYTFSIQVIEGLTDRFQLNIFNVDPQTGVFSYTATNFRTGFTQTVSTGLLSYDTVNFTLGTSNIIDSFGQFLIHALDCTAFLNSDRSLSGICLTIGQDPITSELAQAGGEFVAAGN